MIAMRLTRRQQAFIRYPMGNRGNTSYLVAILACLLLLVVYMYVAEDGYDGTQKASGIRGIAEQRVSVPVGNVDSRSSHILQEERENTQPNPDVHHTNAEATIESENPQYIDLKKVDTSRLDGQQFGEDRMLRSQRKSESTFSMREVWSGTKRYLSLLALTRNEAFGLQAAGGMLELRSPFGGMNSEVRMPIDWLIVSGSEHFDTELGGERFLAHSMPNSVKWLRSGSSPGSAYEAGTEFGAFDLRGTQFWRTSEATRLSGILIADGSCADLGGMAWMDGNFLRHVLPNGETSWERKREEMFCSLTVADVIGDANCEIICGSVGGSIEVLDFSGAVHESLPSALDARLKKSTRAASHSVLESIKNDGNKRSGLIVGSYYERTRPLVEIEAISAKGELLWKFDDSKNVAGSPSYCLKLAVSEDSRKLAVISHAKPFNLHKLRIIDVASGVVDVELELRDDYSEVSGLGHLEGYPAINWLPPIAGSGPHYLGVLTTKTATIFEVSFE